MSRGRLLAWLGPGLGIALLTCGGEPRPPPYGFAAAPEQHYRFEGEDRTEVDGQPVHVQRYADIRLVAEAPERGRTEIALYLDRYYVRVEGAPGGTTELALSERGIATRTPEEGELILGPDAERPGGGPVAELRERPAAGCELGSSGETIGTPWHSFDPILSGIALLDWILFGFPVLAPDAANTWSARRRVPPLGQYQLGMELDLRYERTSSPIEGGQRIRMSGLLQRPTLRIAPDFTGALALDHIGQVELGPEGRLREARLELRMRFDADSGSLVSSEHLVRIRCLDCTGSINSPPQAPDISNE